MRLAGGWSKHTKRAPWTCDRCADVGLAGRAIVGIAIPPVAGWPTFQVCQPCAVELALPAFGQRGYAILRLVAP